MKNLHYSTILENLSRHFEIKDVVFTLFEHSLIRFDQPQEHRNNRDTCLTLKMNPFLSHKASLKTDRIWFGFVFFSNFAIELCFNAAQFATHNSRSKSRRVLIVQSNVEKFRCFTFYCKKKRISPA
ncbi:CLUMA_CG016837, isoform A [Clunio marinus]|uniref:CLUMA_CG016837, isoform A n=1 Tax=Clunio marinus TaxID=568069 RepID=A0A1J1ISL6_9DIPT|nr:CLUMA_CG016837, isoform A [Clunio marinus]